MNFTIRRGASDNTLTITDNGKKHTFALNQMKECKGMPIGEKILNEKGIETGRRKSIPMGRSYRPILPVGLREMVVEAWAKEHGFPSPYEEQEAA